VQRDRSRRGARVKFDHWRMTTSRRQPGQSPSSQTHAARTRWRRNARACG
jgi:hypothetical protein